MSTSTGGRKRPRCAAEPSCSHRQRRGTPKRSMASIARGSAASLDVVENAISAGSLIALKNATIGMRNISMIGISTSRKNAASAIYSVTIMNARFCSTCRPLTPLPAERLACQL